MFHLPVNDVFKGRLQDTLDWESNGDSFLEVVSVRCLWLSQPTVGH